MMRRKILIGGAVALLAIPATAVADKATEPVVDNDPVAEDVAPATTTDKALHADGRGTFSYEGSGGIVLSGSGVVRVRDLSNPAGLVRTPAGFGATTTSKDGQWTRYAGTGTLTLDGANYKVTAAGNFTADVDPTATNAAAGTARVAGRGETTLKGGVPVSYRASQRILLTTGPMSVDLHGRGGPEWWASKPVWRKGYGIPTRIEYRGRDDKGHKGTQSATHRGKDHRSGARYVWWRWNPWAPAATWRINGPASGSVDLTTITGRVRVWDRSTAKDLAVAAPPGTTTTTLSDGSVVYSGLRSAKVTLTGTGFRLKAVGTQVVGAFTPTPGTLARSFVRGKGSFDAGAATGVKPNRHQGYRVLLQPVAAPAPAAVK